MSHTFGEPYAISQEEALERKRKRLFSRSDEDILDDMDDKNLAYRRGFPHLPCLPLTNFSRYVDRLFTPDQKADAIRRVRDICKTQRLDTGVVDLLFRVPEDVNTDGSTDLSSYITLLVEVDMTKDAHKVERVIVMVRQNFLDTTTLHVLKIECLHRGCLQMPPTHPIHPNDITVRNISKSVVDFIIQQLKKANCKWILIEVVRRGLVDVPSRCPPTILISTPTANEERWHSSVLPEIRRELLANAPAFRIELLNIDTIFGRRRQYRPTDRVDQTSYDSSIWMGSSMGLECADFAGATLGGAVVLTGGGKPDVRCGLTNWHAVEDDALSKLLDEKSGALEPRNQTLLSKPFYVASPSVKDHQGFLGSLQARMKNSKEASKDGNVHAQAMYKQADQLFTKTEKADRRIGRIHAGSAYRSMRTPKYATDPKTGRKEKDKSKTQLRFALDWALVEEINDTGRTFLNTLPDKQPPPSAGTLLTASFITTKWSTFNVNKDLVSVAKMGRTSGWTFGQINSELGCITPDDPKFREMAERYGFTAEDPGYCFTVAPPSGASAFMSPGDSGSILLHSESGAWLGLLFGMVEERGLFIAIDRVFQDIKAITGQDVRVPVFTKPETVGLAQYQLPPTE